jgi:protein-disulfide isomerase
MPDKQKKILTGLIVFGIILAVFFGFQLLREQVNKIISQSNFQGLTRPIIYPDTPSRGKQGSKAVVYVYGDYLCPSCKRVEPTVERLYQNYKDRVLFVWKDFPFLYPDSKKAAVAARCADDQDGFWKYKEWMFNNQDDIGIISYGEIAQRIGIDAGKLNLCIESKNKESLVERDFSEGLAIGIPGTPAFVIGDTAFSGEVVYEDLEKAILLELEK